MKFSEKCKMDLIEGKADYIHARDDKGKTIWQRLLRKEEPQTYGGVLHFNGIGVSNEKLSFLVNKDVIASLNMPKSVDLNGGETVTFLFNDGQMSIKLD